MTSRQYVCASPNNDRRRQPTDTLVRQFRHENVPLTNMKKAEKVGCGGISFLAEEGHEEEQLIKKKLGLSKQLFEILEIKLMFLYFAEL